MSGYEARFRVAELAILAAIKGHQTYSSGGMRDTRLVSDDEFGQCKCQACVIARAADIGRTECMEQAREAWAQRNAKDAEEDRAYYAREFSYTDEVPF